MKRPMLVSGIVAIITCTALILFERGTVIIPILAASVLIIYSIKKFNLRKYIIIPTVCICAFVFTVSFIAFNKIYINPIQPYDNTTQNVYGRVNDTPVYKYGFTTFSLKADKIEYEDADFKIDISIYGDHRENIKLFDYIALYDAELSIPKNEDNSYNLSYASDKTILECDSENYEIFYNCDKTPYYYTLRLKELMCEKISSYMNLNQGGLLKGILFGDTNDINAETNKSFKQSGISHLLAVSGMHTSLYCGIIIAVLSAFKVKEKIRNSICLIFLIFFSVISGMSPSVLRAAVMMAVILIAPFFRRDPDSINSLGISVFVLLLFNPYTLLNVGFQLSVVATLGVLIAAEYNEKIYELTKDIPIKKLKKFITGTSSSILMSLFAAIFTLPICAYHFGVFSLLSVFTNILTVELSFYATIAGLIAVCLSFVSIPFTKEIAIFIFKITQFMIDLIIESSKFVAKFKYCTVPIHKDFLIIGIIFTYLMLLCGYMILKFKRNKKIFKTLAASSVIPIIIFSIVPILSPSHKTEIDIIAADNNIQIVLRDGLDYVYLENTSQKLNRKTYNYLPLASCENLKYYLPTYLSKHSSNNPNLIYDSYNPENIIMPESLANYLQKYKNDIPVNTVIQNGGSFPLSSKITVEIIDTKGIKYAIIKGKEKSVYIHFYGDTDFSKYVDTSVCDIAVYNGKIPDNLPENVENVILCGEFYPNEFGVKFPNFKGKLHTTSQHGDISFYI